MTKKSVFRGISSFIIVLLCMPLGHALMIIMEHLLAPHAVNICAFIMAASGLTGVIVGRNIKSETGKTIVGLIGGLLFWTGAVEFCFVYYAHRLGVQPLIENGEITTKPEYLMMPSSIGFFILFMLFYLTSIPNACPFLNFFSRRKDRKVVRNSAMVTFMELNMMMWASYLVLLLCYDNHFVGDHHPFTLMVAFICLSSSVIMFINLLRCTSWATSLRQAIATVIVFWTFVEVMGRLNFLHEIWVQPFTHIPEMLLIVGLLSGVAITSILISRKKNINLR